MLARFSLHMPEVDLKSEAPGRVPVSPAVIMVGTLVVIMPHPTSIRPASHHAGLSPGVQLQVGSTGLEGKRNSGLLSQPHAVSPYA